MKRALLVVAAACGATPPPAAPLQQPEIFPIAIEWRAAQSDDHRVDVSLVIDGHAEPLGQLDAATETEPGTPATCAIRRADATGTEFQCGGGTLFNYFIAELAGNEIVVTLVRGTRGPAQLQQRGEVKRIPVAGTVLQVAPYALP